MDLQSRQTKHQYGIRQSGTSRNEVAGTSRFRYIRPALLKCRSTGEGGDFGTGLYRERDFC